MIGAVNVFTESLKPYLLMCESQDKINQNILNELRTPILALEKFSWSTKVKV